MRPLCIATRRLSPPVYSPCRLGAICVATKLQIRSATYVLPEKTYLGDMGKDKVPYQLKTPKGTKDCMCDRHVL